MWLSRESLELSDAPSEVPQETNVLLWSNVYVGIFIVAVSPFASFTGLRQNFLVHQLFQTNVSSIDDHAHCLNSAQKTVWILHRYLNSTMALDYRPTVAQNCQLPNGCPHSNISPSHLFRYEEWKQYTWNAHWNYWITWIISIITVFKPTPNSRRQSRNNHLCQVECNNPIHLDHTCFGRSWPYSNEDARTHT
jgi:hypothetical protein